MAKAQAISHALGDAGFETVSSTPRFNRRGVSVSQGPDGSVMVFVDYASMGDRNHVERLLIAFLLDKGYTVTGNGGILTVKNA